MDEISEVSVLVKDSNKGSRKRPKSNESKRSAKKRELYCKPINSKIFIPCKHNTKQFQCNKFRPRDALQLRELVYRIPQKHVQERIISRFIILKDVKRRRSRTNVKTNAKTTEFQRKLRCSTSKWYQD